VLELIRSPGMPGDLFGLGCLHCGEPLTVHVPDLGFPERMLGVCEACKYWFLFDLSPDEAEVVAVRLPNGGFFRDAFKDE
jgi:hypothetical protein